jgi:hypothetical protein
MNYSLGNMLSRGGSLNANGLSLDLQFATDKSLTARKGPTPIFTRASTGTFIGSNGLIQSAAINAARFDHDPITLACKGLLIEESRTNILTGNSQDLSGSGWTGLGLANNDPLIADPRGTVGGVYYVTLNERLCSFNGSGTVMCLSFFAKQRTGGGTGVTIQVFQNTTPSAINLGTQLFLFTGTMTPATNFTSLTRTEYPNGWYRFTAVLTAPSGSFNSSARIDIEGAISSNYTWGFQVEAGAFPTSYIPTITGSVVRSADVCSITGSDFTGMYNQSEGSVFVKGSSSGRGAGTFGTASFFFDVALNTNNRISFIATSGTVRPEINSSSVSNYLPTGKTYTSNTIISSSLGIRNGETSSAFLDNSAYTGGTNLLLTAPSVTSFNIGRASSNTNFCNGHIQSVRYFKKRLADAKLQALTV